MKRETHSGVYLPRPRLMQHLTQAQPPRCVLLQGPAGSGKSSLLAEWRRALIVQGKEVAWLALQASDTSAAGWLDACWAALHEMDGAWCAEAEAVDAPDAGSQCNEAAVIALVRAMARYARPVVLMVDDAHHLHQPEALVCLQLLLDYAPDNVQCVLATRAPLPVFLVRMRDQGQLLELPPDELRFTLDETRSFVSNRLGCVSERDVRNMHERTEGWVTGLQWLCMGQRTSLGAADMEAYFHAQVMQQLGDAELELLTLCALPAQFDAVLCEVMLADQAMAASSALNVLGHSSLFMEPAGSRYPEGWYRLHPLLREVLQERLAARSPEQLKRLHELIWLYFAKHEMLHDAVLHAQAAGQSMAAAALLETHAPALFARRELRRLASLVLLLPEALVRQQPGLRLWLGWALLYQQRLSECTQLVAHLAQELADESPLMRYQLTLLKAAHAMQSDDSQAAVALLDRLQAMPEGADAMMQMARNSLLSWIHLHEGDYERVHALQQKLMTPVIPKNVLDHTTVGRLVGRCIAGLTHAVQGQMLQAERVYRDVLFETQRHGSACAEADAMAAALLGDVLYELNDLQGVLALLEPRQEGLMCMSLPDTRMRFTLSFTRALNLLGRPRDAWSQLEQVANSAAARGEKRLHASVLLAQIYMLVHACELDKAWQLWPALQALAASTAHVARGAQSEIQVIAGRAHIRLLLQGGDMLRALDHLKPVMEVCRQQGRARIVPQLQLQAAVALCALGEHDAAQEQVRQALRGGHALGLLRTMLDAHETVPALLAQTRAGGALDAVLHFYAERLEAASRSHHAGWPLLQPETGPGREVLSPREQDVTTLLLQNLSNKRIARALGVSLDTVKWHLKNIYGKLGASGRDDVMRRLM